MGVGAATPTTVLTAAGGVPILILPLPAAPLNHHMLTHSGERPFPCPNEDCDYVATQSGALSKHMRTHSGERPFPCTVEGCNYAATQSGALTRHMRKQHSGEQTRE